MQPDRILPQYITAQLSVPPAVAETLEAHQLTYDFRGEVQYRQAHDQYCQWYDAVAAQHRQELLQMQTELNILGWLRGNRWSSRRSVRSDNFEGQG